MGRILPDGSVFNPKVKARFLQQRVPIDEAVARSWMTPRGVKAGLDLIGSIPTPEFGAPEKPALTRAKAIAETRVPQTAIVSTATSAPPAATAPAATAKPDPVDDAARRIHSKDAAIASRLMKESGMPGLPGMDPDPGATQETYQLQMQLVANGYMTPEEWATGPGILGPRTQKALAKRDAAPPPLMPIPPATAPVPEAPPAAAPAPGVAEVIREGISMGPAAPVPAPTAPTAPTAPPAPAAPPATAAIATQAPEPVEVEEAVEVIPDTLEGRVHKFLADLHEGPGGETFEGQRNSLRSLAMQANTADAQDVVMRAMQYVKPRARNIRDHLTGAHKDRFRKEIMSLFPGIKKEEEEKPLTEAEKLDLDIKRERLGQIREKRLADQAERDRRKKGRKISRVPKRPLSGKALMDEFEKAIDQAGDEYKANRVRVDRLRERRQAMRDRVANLKAQLPKPDKRGKFTPDQEGARGRINKKINELGEALKELNDEFDNAVVANEEVRAYQLQLRTTKNDPDLSEAEKQRLLAETADDYRRGYSFLEEELEGNGEPPGAGEGKGQTPAERAAKEAEVLRKVRERNFPLPPGPPRLETPRRPGVPNVPSLLVYNPAAEDSGEELQRLVDAIFDSDAKRKVFDEQIGDGVVKALIYQGRADEAPEVILEGADGVLSEKGQRILIEQYKRGRYKPNGRFRHPITFD